MSYSISEIAEILEGENYIASGNAIIDNLILDSRRIHFPATSLFYAIKGTHHDGHKFIKEVYDQGVFNFIVQDAHELKSLKNINYIIVKDSVEALQKVASFHRTKFNIPVIGITGSNGKTIIKEWLHQLLSKDHQVVRSPKSYNSQVGVPLSIWQMNNLHQMAIFEAGISKKMEMAALEKIIQPSIGIFSNIGTAHDEGFSSIEEKIKEKLLLFKNVEVLIYRKDHELIDKEISHIKKGIKTFTWGHHKEADIFIRNISEGYSTSSVTLLYKNIEHHLTIPFKDASSVENTLHCVATLLYLGYEIGSISDRFIELQSLPLRLEMKEAIQNCTLIYDCYNSDLNSLKIALDFLDQQHQHEQKTIILSDILQSGKDEDALYTEVGKMLAKKNLYRIIGIGEALQKHQEKLHIKKGQEYHFYFDTASFLEHIDALKFKDESILLKGARPFKFEEIGKAIEAKTHDTVLEINLNAIAHNLKVYKNLLKPQVKLMIMVKAFGYGAGGFEVASLLQYHHADYLSVAYADEAVELRKAGIRLPIMVLNPEGGNLDNFFKYDLEPEIYSFRILNQYINAVKLRENKFDKIPPIHLKIDTGMHRLGFEEGDIDDLLTLLQSHRSIKIASIFSHLSSSDQQDHDDFTFHQIETFKAVSSKVIQALDYPILRHILNSAAIARFPDHQFEMVRLGIGLYGVDPSEKIQQQLMTISTLKTTISQIKVIEAADAVGYNRKGTVDRRSRIATVGIGYADGLSRNLGNKKAYMMVWGKKAPIIGNICMDMTMIDVTDIPEAREGDEVIVFGKELPIQQLAEWDNTIPYEILTRISKRVRRVYFEE